MKAERNCEIREKERASQTQRNNAAFQKATGKDFCWQILMPQFLNRFNSVLFFRSFVPNGFSHASYAERHGLSDRGEAALADVFSSSGLQRVNYDKVLPLNPPQEGDSCDTDTQSPIV